MASASDKTTNSFNPGDFLSNSGPANLNFGVSGQQIQTTLIWFAIATVIVVAIIYRGRRGLS